MEEETWNGKVEAGSPKKVERHDRDERQEANQVPAQEVESTDAGNCLLVIEAHQVDDAEQGSSETRTENLEEDEQVAVSDNTTLVPVETPRSSSSLAEEPSEDVKVKISEAVHHTKTDEPIQQPAYEGKERFSEMNLDEQEIPILEENPAELSEEPPVNQNRDLLSETTNHSVSIFNFTISLLFSRENQLVEDV